MVLWRRMALEVPELYTRSPKELRARYLAKIASEGVAAEAVAAIDPPSLENWVSVGRDRYQGELHGLPGVADGSLRAGHGDSNGADLFSSTDGVTWELARHVWPFTCGYSAMVETSTDASGGALTYALLFEAGGVVGAEQMLAFMNFTGKP